MTVSKKIIWTNLLILLFYNVFLNTIFSKNDSNIFIGLAYLITLQVLVNLALAIIHLVKGSDHNASAYFLSLALVLLIGFSTCLGAASL